MPKDFLWNPGGTIREESKGARESQQLPFKWTGFPCEWFVPVELVFKPKGREHWEGFTDK